MHHGNGDTAMKAERSRKECTRLMQTKVSADMSQKPRTFIDS